MSSRRRLAVIDLGSNSFRLVLFRAKGWTWERVEDISEAVRIGEGLSATGRLGAGPMERALETLDMFADFCRANDLEDEEIDAVATSAIRDAENQAEFLERAEKRTGLSIRVLSPEAEAHYGYMAVINTTTLMNGCVLDLGGGSMQLVNVVDRLERDSGSWPLGTVRTTERFLAEGPTEAWQLEALREHVRSELEPVPWLSESGWRLVGLGGTLRNLSTAASRALGVWPANAQGLILERAALDELIERIAPMSIAERAAIPGIKASRADLILAGAIVVQCVLEIGRFQALETIEAGLREGIFFESLAPRDLRFALLAS